MDFNQFIGKLYEAAEPASDDLKGILGSNKWKYIPTQSWDAGTLKVVIEEVADNQWMTYFLKPTAKVSGAGLAAAKAKVAQETEPQKESAIKEILKFQKMLSEAAGGEGGVHGDKKFSGEGWEVSKKIPLDFEGTLKGCVYLVTEKGGKASDSGFVQASKKN